MSPLPLGISNDLPWGWYGFFLEVHNINKLISLQQQCKCTRMQGKVQQECTLLKLKQYKFYDSFDATIKMIN